VTVAALTASVADSFSWPRVLAAAFVAMAGGTALLWSLGKSAASPSFARLTANPSDVPIHSGQISPDGRYLAFGDSTGVQVRSIDAGQTRRFDDTKDMKVYGWTPDSSSVLASRCDEITCVGWAISLVGQQRHRTGAVWSPSAELVRVAPDGQRLLRFAFASVPRH
jgi:hypothetical protein